jgi:ABC-type Fe3+ transport system permease subunit
MVWSNGFGAAFGLGASDPDTVEVEIIGKAIKDRPTENPFTSASILAIFYFLLLLVVLVVTLASVTLDRVSIKLPPGIQQAIPMRWGIVAAANLVLFLFLALQLLVGFGMESNYRAWVEKNVGPQGAKTTPEIKVRDADQGLALSALRYTFWQRLVVLLHLIAVTGSLLMFWIDRRGSNRPLPHVDLVT